MGRKILEYNSGLQSSRLKECIREYLLRTKTKQKDLASRIPIKENTFSEIVNGRRRLTEQTAEDLLRIINEGLPASDYVRYEYIMGKDNWKTVDDYNATLKLARAWDIPSALKNLISCLDYSFKPFIYETEKSDFVWLVSQDGKADGVITDRDKDRIEKDIIEYIKMKLNLMKDDYILTREELNNAE